MRDLILGKDDLPTRPVKVPEWDCTVHVRMMTGDERDAWEQWLVDTQSGRTQVRARYCVLTMVDEKGKRIFKDTKADIDALGQKSAAALDRIFSAALSLNGMSASEQEAASGN